MHALIDTIAVAGGEAEAVGLVIGVVLACVIVAVLLVMRVWTQVLLMQALSSIPQEHRSIRPALVWTQLIPLLGVVCTMIVLPNVVGSVASATGRRAADCGQGLAWTTIFAAVLGTVLWLMVFVFSDEHNVAMELTMWALAAIGVTTEFALGLKSKRLATAAA